MAAPFSSVPLGFPPGNSRIRQPYAPIRSFVLASLCLASFFVTAAWGVRPCEQLLPDTTKFCVLIADLEELRTNFNLTQLGRMMNDPLMRPFVDDLRRQLRERIDEEGRSTGLTWEDIDAMDGGEICFAKIQPGGNDKQQATVVIVDVSGHQQQADDVLAKVHQKQLELGATFASEMVPGTETELKIYTFPPQKVPTKKDNSPAEQRVLFVHEDQLVGVSHKQEAIAVRRRCDDEHTDRLADIVAYQGAMQRVAAEYQQYGDPPPHARWFLEPYGFAQVQRAIEGSRQRRGMDMLKIWNETGFREAIQGAGGFVNFAHQGRDVLHRSLVYAPPVERSEVNKATSKYNLAARMLQFPSTSDLFPEPWIPRELASFVTFNWKTRDASVFVEPLVDKILGGDDGQGTYTDIKDSLKNDENGPQVDVDEEYFAFLDDRMIWLTDYEVPISTKCERVILAVRTSDPEKLAATIRKTTRTDDSAHEFRIGGFDVWEIDERNVKGIQIPKVEVGEENDDLPFLFGEGDEENEDDEEPMFPYRLTTVAHGYLITATHRELLQSVLQNRAANEHLGSCVDYTSVLSDLKQLGANQDSLRLFSRLDEQLRPTYELTQQGLMPQSETLFGKFLNWYLGVSDEESREQLIDGSEMPDYEVARRYLGPTGLYIQTEEDGWFIAGSLIPKDSQPATARVVDESAKTP